MTLYPAPWYHVPRSHLLMANQRPRCPSTFKFPLSPMTLQLHPPVPLLRNMNARIYLSVLITFAKTI